MSTVKTDSSRYAAIAAAIRAKNGETALYTPAEMAAKIAAITTGTELDYAVVCAAERPTAPLKNTLWVRDGADAPDVRFSLTAPGTPTANMLWIEQGAQSTAPFEPVKNGGITVYPRRARQYSATTSAWTLLRAELYNGTGWVDLCIPIYASGDECTAMSGGWNVASTSWSTAGSGIPASITKNTDHIFITGNSYKVTGGSGYRLTTVSPLDLTDVERIGMSVSELTGQGMLGVLAQGGEIHGSRRVPECDRRVWHDPGGDDDGRLGAYGHELHLPSYAVHGGKGDDAESEGAQMLDILTRQTVDTAVETARAIAADARHGYDQTERWGPDYDCSSLVIHVWRAAGVPLAVQLHGRYARGHAAPGLYRRHGAGRPPERRGTSARGRAFELRAPHGALYRGWAHRPRERQ